MSTINDRFKEIRDDNHLSQEGFGRKIGLSKSGISNIESAKRSVTNKHIKLLCSEFKINEAWLRTGEGEKKAPEPKNALDELAKVYDLSDDERMFFEMYLKQPKSGRDAVFKFLSDISAATTAKAEQEKISEACDTSQEICTIEEAKEAYIKSRSKPAKKTEQSVLNTTEDAVKTDKVVNQ